MYQSYWHLTHKPFEDGWDARFYYPSEVHQGALLKLRYGVEHRRGAVLLAGAAGLGKTLLFESLRRQCHDDLWPLVDVLYPQMPTEELLAYLADELESALAGTRGVDRGGGTRGGERGYTNPAALATASTDGRFATSHSIRRLRDALDENARAGRHAVIFIDEAHLLNHPEGFEAVRLLLNFGQSGRPSATIVLVGQPVLLPLLERMPALEQRLGVKCLLRPLTPDETISYVSHRLTAAGAARMIFEPDALEAIHDLSHGVCRQINRLCDLSLLIGYAEEQHTITAAAVEAVCEELVKVSPE
jgi:type II secretory pathway predicted ATPase ExeA